MSVQQTKKSITGVVNDENGECVPGANVVVKGTTNGCMTDIDGNFSLQVKEGDILLVSFIGYAQQEVLVSSSKTNYVVNLVPETHLLDEVVVTGYQTISKERATGSFAIMTPKDMEGKLQTNILERMEGMVAGLQNAPGQSVPTIRGRSTLTGDQFPLYVVDGIPYEGDLDAINPADIVNVTVLKDATAASIYGARSANGVIVITTRNGQKGKTRVRYDGSVKFTPLPSRSYMNLTNTAETIGLMEELYGYYHNPYITDDIRSTNEIYLLMYKRDAGEISQAEYDTQMNAYKQMDGYNSIKDELVRKAEITQQHNLSFSGGSDIYKYAISANYSQNNPYDKVKSSRRFGFNFKNEFNFFKWLQVNVGFMNSYVKADYDNGFSGYDNLYIRPYRELRNADGTPAAWTMNRSQLGLDDLINKGLYDETYRPLNEMDKAHFNQDDKYQNINVSARFKILPELNATVYFQNEKTDGFNTQYYDVNSYTMKTIINDATAINPDGTFTHYMPEGGRLTENFSRRNSYTLRAQVDYNKEFGIHGVQALLGTERRQVKSKKSSFTKWGYDPQSLAFKSFNELQLGNGVSGTEAVYGSYYFRGPYDSWSESEDRFVSFYGNASYTFNHQLTATGSIRIDQSNLFGTDPKYQYRPLWSAGLHYVALKDWNWIDRLAVRGTFGVNGNIPKHSGPYMIAAVSSRPNYNTQEFYSYISTPPNPFLRWEKTNVLNLGVDFDLLKNRLSGSIEFYNKKTTDLLGNQKSNPTSGWTSLLLNYGEMYNRGIELTLHSENIRTRDFSWSTDFIFSWNKNKLTKIENSGTSAYSYFESAQNRVDYPMGAIFTVRYAGLDEEGLPQAYKKDGTVVNDYSKLAPEDLKYEGTVNPPFSASLSNRLTYKGFDLDFMFVYYGGHVLRDVAAGYLFTMYPVMNNTSAVDKDRLNFWRQPGDELNPDMAPAFLYRNPRQGQVAYLWQAADKHIEKGDYIKLRDLSVGYTFPKAWIGKLMMQDLRVNLQVQNLWYWAANKNDLDPEVWTGTALSPSRGRHIPATWTLGLSASF